MDKKDTSHRAFSPRTLAAAIGVSESSVKRWIDAGMIQVSRTAGGHRRVPLHAAVKFIREQGMEVLQPDALGLPQHATDAVYSDPSLLTGDLIFDLLLSEHAEQAAAHVVSAYVAGGSVAEMFDGPIRDALERIGELWHANIGDIFYEHRAIQLFLHALGQIRMLMPPPASEAPHAVGGAPANDPHLIPSDMTAIVCASVGIRETNLGPFTPTEAFEKAIAATDASIIWLSLSSELDDDPRNTVRLVESKPGLRLILGGRHAHELYEEIDREKTAILFSMQELEDTLNEMLETD